MISAYLSTLGFGTYFYFAGVWEVYIPTYLAFLLFVVFGIISFYSGRLVILFRLSITIAFLAFYNQVFHTGGITSPALMEFIIPPLLAFFYRPIKDRYIFMVFSLLAMLSFWPLSALGLTQSLLPVDYHASHSLLCGIFVFSIVAIFTVLFRTAIAEKNKKLGVSMRQLQDTTQKLVHSEKMASLGVLSAGVAHEINNPLNFIKGGMELLEKELQSNGEKELGHEDYLDIMKEGLTRVGGIVNSLSHFSRQTEAMDETCNLNSILENSIIMLQPKLKYKGTLSTNYCSHPVEILGNAGKLHQAFLNFIANAEQAIDEDGEIHLSTKVANGRAMVELEDTGIGIPQENLDKISDPFFTTKPVGQGTGLGLSISYKIIEEHAGKIEVNSVPGKGTKFTISFQTL